MFAFVLRFRVPSFYIFYLIFYWGFAIFYQAARDPGWALAVVAAAKESSLCEQLYMQSLYCSPSGPIPPVPVAGSMYREMHSLPHCLSSGWKPWLQFRARQNSMVSVKASEVIVSEVDGNQSGVVL